MHTDDRNSWFPTSTIPSKRQTIQNMMIEMSSKFQSTKDTKKEHINIIDNDDDELQIIEQP
jgi:hypothetical protein